ncbi:MAG TPA: glucoamylase family protein [Tepidisphaeraceae bacterium]|jgi:hypothetical protein
MINRRTFLAATLASGASLWMNKKLLSQPTSNPTDDNALLDDLSRRSFQFFWEQTDPNTGIVRDRARSDGSEYPKEKRDVGTTGGTGFALTAMCIGADRNWVSRADAKARVLATLRSFANGPVKNEHGWWYHFINTKSGERTGAGYDIAALGPKPNDHARRPYSEMSTSDSTWLVAGALTARQFFKEDPEVVKLATQIYERVDYQWMCDGKPTLSHGWTPEEGHIKNHYDKYCQLACMYLLGIASPVPEHAMPASDWYAWERNPNEYKGYKYVGTSVLWTYQWPFCWFDLRNRREAKDSKVNYFENSATATRAHKQFCIDLAEKFPGCYSENLWGITSSESAHGYKAWGGPPAHSAIDGSVVPCASAGSIMFTPDIVIPVIREMKDRFGDKIYGRYGFVDAFHPTNGWVCPDVLAIDIGITLLAIENYRTGNVWKWFMANPEPQKALELAQLNPDS